MRLVVPSWLAPGGWLENLEAASRLGWASGMEFLFFSFEGEDRALFLSEYGRVRQALASSCLSPSVHLPDPLLPGHAELVELFSPLAECFILHPPKADGLAEWRRLVAGLREAHGDRFLLEYTGAGTFAGAETALPGLPLCADTGRLLLEGLDPLAWLSRQGDRVREIHLHGLSAGAQGLRDHEVFSGLEPWLAGLRPFLEVFEGRIELELFSLEKVEAAYKALKEPR